MLDGSEDDMVGGDTASDYSDLDVLGGLCMMHTHLLLAAACDWCTQIKVGALSRVSAETLKRAPNRSVW